MRTLKELLYQAVGHASTCWADLKNAGVYDSTAAAKIAEQLETDIRTHQYAVDKKLTREEVYKLIDGERQYQDSMWNPETTPTGGSHTPTEWLVYIQDYANEALHIGTRESDATAREKQLAILRKIAALAVSGMEEHGAPTRQPKAVTPRTY